MAWIDHRLGSQRRYFFEGCGQLRRIREGKIGSADGSREQAVANQRDSVAVDDDVAGRVPGRVQHCHLGVPDLDLLAIRELVVGGRWLFEGKAIYLRLQPRGFVAVSYTHLTLPT